MHRGAAQVLESDEIDAAYLNPFCGVNGAIPLHFDAGVKPIQFEGGKGVRFLISSANYRPSIKWSTSSRGFRMTGAISFSVICVPILHPYIVESSYGKMASARCIAWKEGQYDAAAESYDVFNSRIETLLNPGVVPLYPSLEFVDAMLASIVIK